MKNFDLKSIITLILIITLVVLASALIVAMIFGFVPSDNPVLNSIITVFVSSVTGVITYFFTRKSNKDGDKT